MWHPNSDIIVCIIIDRSCSTSLFAIHANLHIYRLYSNRSFCEMLIVHAHRTLHLSQRQRFKSATKESPRPIPVANITTVVTEVEDMVSR
jgi:hypothetical protein